MASPIIAQGTGYVLFAYDVAHAFDLAAAETRLASATQRQTVKQKRRAPAFFEYDPAPLRVTEPADSLAVGEHVTAPYVEFVLYDFGAVSVSYAIPLQGPLTGLPALSTILYGNEQLQADSRRRVQQLIEALGDAAIRSRLADFVEDYVVFQIEAFTEPLAASMLWTEHAQTVAQVLRAESRPLSQQEVSDALARSEEHTSELQSQSNLVCRLLLEKKKQCCSMPPLSVAIALVPGHATRPYRGSQD